MGHKNIHRLCLGTAQWGMTYGVANKTGQPSFSEINEMIAVAISSGVKYFDTAQSYGESEEMLGKTLSGLKIDQRPKIITKLNPNLSFHSIHDLEETISLSLERLHVPSLWGLLLHRSTGWQKLIEGVKILKKKNLFENFGVSVYEPDEALHFLKQDFIDIIQVPFNIMDRRFIDNGFLNLA